jgi:uncharacterized protein with NAD-binding domain and iron-sulfur cluster
MAALTAAWQLSAPGWQDELESITVYQRGFRLGGKGASSRGQHGRIEEHGLHILLGYYENSFAVLRDVYAELDRPRTDPDCPIGTWRDAFAPVPFVGVEDHRAGAWHHWLASFPTSDDAPGDGSPPPLTPLRFVVRGAQLLEHFVASIDRSEHGSGSFRLSASPPRPDITGTLVRTARAGLLAAVAEIAHLTARFADAVDARSTPIGPLLRALDDASSELDRWVDDDIAAGRILLLIDLIATSMRGIVVDGLLTGPIGFPDIDHLDFREWLQRHGARPSTTGSAIVRGLYDLVFGYEEGDPDRPSFSAGLGLFLAGKMFFDYRGSLFWRMSAGMGDVVFAPMYQALHQRGVRFEFLHRVDELRLSADGCRVAEIRLSRQAVARGDELDPLVRVRGLPCFPTVLPADRLAADSPEATLDLERHGADGEGDPVVLRDGHDFDAVVFGLSLGAVPIVAPELVERLPAWRAMVDEVRTVPTQALQLWLHPTEAELGFPASGAVVSGYVSPFDTFASMTHLLGAEDWPEASAPGTIAYFCSALAEHVEGEPVDRVRRHAMRFVERDLGHFFPAASTPAGGFDWDTLCAPDDLVGADRIDAQLLVASVDPSDRYVQSRPGSTRFRMRPDGSGIDNLVPAGDWVASGLEAGCLESAALAGIQAANVVLGRPLRHGVLGVWRGGT